MIDTDKYEGHTPMWYLDDELALFPKVFSDFYGSAMAARLAGGDFEIAEVRSQNKVDAQLIADAPLLLAEVKRLRGLLKITAQSYLDCVRAEDMLGEVSVKKEYETCKEIGDVIGATINDKYYFTYEKEGEEE